MKESDVMLSFKGDISQELSIGVANILKNKLSNDKIKLQLTKKVFSIFVELAQNIYRYSSEIAVFDNKRLGTGVFLIRETDTYFMIIAGNMVKKSEIQSLIEHCQSINQLTEDELKQVYKKRLKQPREEGKVGAGVGLISVVRKAGNPIQFESISVDVDHAFFVLSIQINKEE
jgi:hypothetical protein